MKPISTSIYTFEELINLHYVYVDKTKYLYEMIRNGKNQFFCARPRRFGKSLTISTLEAICEGKRELFKGLYIDGTDYDWETCPIIHIDFARSDLRTISAMESSLKNFIRRTAEKYDVTIDDDTPANMFESLVTRLYQNTLKKVVILVDEYDKPIFEHLENARDAGAYRDYLAGFYQIIKGTERYLRFVFITGVTRFAKVSIFSKLNNLDDISMDSRYATMMGYTQKELETSFGEYIDDAVSCGVKESDGTKINRDDFLSKIKKWYDGFCFVVGEPSVYNPVSVGQFFLHGYDFVNYWFATGTPTFLMKLLRKNHIVLSDLIERTVSESSFETFSLAELGGFSSGDERVTQLLLQTGYLTMDRLLWSDPEKVYLLRFPNHEVSYSFARNLFMAYAPDASASDDSTRVRIAAMNGDTSRMMESLKGFFASLPYDIQVKTEKYYQSIAFTVFRMCGFDIKMEMATNIGRIDGVLDAGRHLYVMEFKLNKSAEAALAQIDERGYAEQFIVAAHEKGKTVHALGVNFSYADGERNITDWKEKIV